MGVVFHVYPIPRGMTDDEAWAELEALDHFIEYRWWRLRFRWPLVKWASRRVEQDDEE